MAGKLGLSDLPLKGKKILMRVDFNVPLDKQGNITDDSRINASLPSIRYVLDQGGALILMSHLGRPKGVTSPEFSLAPVAKLLSEKLQMPVPLAPQVVGPEVERLASDLEPGQVLLLENLRFHKGEEKPEQDPSFAQQLAKLGDLYVNDAFGTAHRAHASVDAVPRLFYGKAAAGFLLEKEIQFLGGSLLDPLRPFIAMLGGAKLSTKLGVVKILLEKADALLIGGGMAYSFYKAQGIPIGNSIHEDDFLETCREILDKAQKENRKLVLPVDLVIAQSVEAGAPTRVIAAAAGIPDGWQGVDIGPKTVELFRTELLQGATVFWNGPMGVFEIPEFAKGTNALASIVSKLEAVTVVGGGDSIAALQASGMADRIDHLSTGGGASLEYIEKGTLPGIEALTETSQVIK